MQQQIQFSYHPQAICFMSQFGSIVTPPMQHRDMIPFKIIAMMQGRLGEGIYTEGSSVWVERGGGRETQAIRQPLWQVQSIAKDSLSSIQCAGWTVRMLCVAVLCVFLCVLFRVELCCVVFCCVVLCCVVL